MSVRAKKHLGQHFLKDEEIANNIVEALSNEYKNVLELGPGMGVLTKYLIKKDFNFKVIEIDSESVEYLKQNYIKLSNSIIEADFLKMDLKSIFNSEQFSLIGNFPYNISSQIMFKVLENNELIPSVVGMFQKEVAERLGAKKGNKTYGILSVLLSIYYDIEYLFTVNENVFIPAPKVKSGVIRLVRKQNINTDFDADFLKKLIKTSFGQRRKTLRNAIKSLNPPKEVLEHNFMDKRAEELSYEDFIFLSKLF